MALVIVNADDYGLTAATSRTILDCHRRGIVTSTSVLVPAPGFSSTVGWLSSESDLGVGVHLALVGEDPPLLSAAEIPTLVGSGGRFRRSWREFAVSAASCRIDPDDVQRELSAQISAVMGAGAKLTHLDSHQHLHQWPTLWPVIRGLAVSAGVSAVRTTRTRRPGPMMLLGSLASMRADRDGLRTTDAFIGHSTAGRMVESSLRAAIERIPAGVRSVEIGCHPGAAHDPDRSRYEWGYRWAEEAAALTSGAVRAQIARAEHRLGNFGDLRGGD